MKLWDEKIAVALVGGREAAGECDAVILLMRSLLRRPLLVERRKNDLFE